MKIGITGVPSCGKTTLAKRICQDVNNIYVPEIARIYIKTLGKVPQGDDHYKIAQIQSELEKELEDVNRLTVCDTPPYISAIYDNLYNNGQNVSKILELSKQHKYDIIFNINNILEYEEDGVRYHTKGDLTIIEELIDKYNKGQNVININKIYLDERVRQVKRNI